jgi:hypothetical protein
MRSDSAFVIFAPQTLKITAAGVDFFYDLPPFASLVPLCVLLFNYSLFGCGR